MAIFNDAKSGNTNQQVALHDAVEYCAIPASFSFHSALHDALYTALVAEFLGKKALAFKVSEKKLRRFSQFEFNALQRRRIGPFARIEALLNGKITRKMECPICGEKRWISEWRTCDSKRYFSSFHCLEHGKFICKLSAFRTDDGQFSANLSVPEITLELVEEFGKASKGTSYKCVSMRHRKRRRRSGAATNKQGKTEEK